MVLRDLAFRCCSAMLTAQHAYTNCNKGSFLEVVQLVVPVFLFPREVRSVRCTDACYTNFWLVNGEVDYLSWPGKELRQFLPESGAPCLARFGFLISYQPLSVP